MSLLQMSFYGAVMILVIVILRVIAIHKLPKKVFLLLWEIVLLRLLVPFSFPSVLSVYSLLEKSAPVQKVLTEMPVLEGINHAAQNGAAQSEIVQGGMVSSEVIQSGVPESGISQSDMLQTAAPTVSVWFVIWLAGLVLCAGYFVITYFRWRGEFLASLPVNNAFVQAWKKEHPLKRNVKIRQSGKISAPLTYGVFRPIILMPKNTDWEDEGQLRYVFMHEYIHIRRFDTMRKLIATAALCMHWFNPLVWLMYILFNRDIELACDEGVVRKFGENSRGTYARALISMEETKSGLRPLCNNFSKNVIEERIRAIMKTKKVTFGIACISVIVVGAVAVLFATSAGKTPVQDDTPVTEAVEENRADFIMIQFEDQMGETVADLYTFDGFSIYIPQTWISYCEYMTPPAVLTLQGAGGEIWIECYENENPADVEARLRAEGYVYDKDDAKWRKAEGTLIKRVQLEAKQGDVWALFRVYDEALVNSRDIDVVADTCIFTGIAGERLNETEQETIFISDSYYYEPARYFYEMDWENISTKISSEEKETLQKFLPVLNGEQFTWIYRSAEGENLGTYVHGKKEVTIRQMLAAQLGVHGIMEVEPLLDSFYFADVFRTGSRDMVLCLRNMAYEWLILHEEDGVVYGIDMSIRWFSKTYENGLYVGSGGADDHTYSKMKFENGDYVTETVARVYMDTLIIDGEQKSAAEFETWKAENLKGLAKSYNPLGEAE